MAGRILRAAVCLAFVGLAGAAGAVPGLNERIVSDPATGLALYGYDPVAYFTDGRPAPGSRFIEAEWGGAAWRFASEAHRAAFLSVPEVYAPRFGGYDPDAIASGVPIAGHPLLFRIVGERLYLFQSYESRDGFRDPGPAERAWPSVLERLTN